MKRKECKMVIAAQNGKSSKPPPAFMLHHSGSGELPAALWITGSGGAGGPVAHPGSAGMFWLCTNTGPRLGGRTPWTPTLRPNQWPERHGGSWQGVAPSGPRLRLPRPA